MKQRTSVDWAGGNPAVKSALLGWMAYVFARRDPRTKEFPDTPALGSLIASGRKDLWTDDCYKEMLLLGEIAGFSFKQYVLKFPRHIDREGCCLALPIVLDDENSGVQQVRMGAGSSGVERNVHNDVSPTPLRISKQENAATTGGPKANTTKPKKKKSQALSATRGGKLSESCSESFLAEDVEVFEADHVTDTSQETTESEFHRYVPNHSELNSKAFSLTVNAVDSTEQISLTTERKNMSHSEFRRFVWNNFTEKCV